MVYRARLESESSSGDRGFESYPFRQIKGVFMLKRRGLFAGLAGLLGLSAIPAEAKIESLKPNQTFDETTKMLVKDIRLLLDWFAYAPNADWTRASISEVVQRYLDGLVNEKLISAPVVYCSEWNNPPAQVDLGGIIVDVYFSRPEMAFQENFSSFSFPSYGCHFETGPTVQGKMLT